MDCPGGHDGDGLYAVGREASTLVLMDCPGGPVDFFYQAVHKASTLVLMDCPGGLGAASRCLPAR